MVEVLASALCTGRLFLLRSMSKIVNAMRDICEDKGIPYESVLETVEAALAAAYRKDFGERTQNVKVEFDPKTAVIRAYDEKEVVEDAFVASAVAEMEARQRMREIEEALRTHNLHGAMAGAVVDIVDVSSVVQVAAEVAESTEAAPSVASDDQEATPLDGHEGEEAKKYNPKLHLALTEAQAHQADVAIGDVIRIDLEVPGNFGRMAAQTAKQVITQRLREAERDTIYNEWKEREGEVVLGTVQRREGRTVLVDIGPRATGFLREEDQIPTDRYVTGMRLKCLLSSVGKSMRGPELLLSRTHPNLLRYLFSVEVPEVSAGSVELVAVAREPGSRAKVAVRSLDEGVDPIGACIGQRGTRVQTIIAELSGEKIDIIEHDDDAKQFITHAMAPAKVVQVELDEESRNAVVYVNADQFSLAIGRSGQNVRLAVRLTGWKINVREFGGDSSDQDDAEPEAESAEALESGEVVETTEGTTETAPLAMLGEENEKLQVIEQAEEGEDEAAAPEHPDPANEADTTDEAPKE
jgi:transcription termination/antitermination protein NusA